MKWRWENRNLVILFYDFLANVIFKTLYGIVQLMADWNINNTDMLKPQFLVGLPGGKADNDGDGGSDDGEIFKCMFV